MGWSPIATPGQNLYPGGSGTFPQLKDAMKGVAENRDTLDAGLRQDAQTKANTAEANAKTHADEKDTANRSAWASADATVKAEAIAAADKNAREWSQANAQTFGAALGTTHLDTVLTIGIRSQTVSSNVTSANGYPPGEASTAGREYRGTLITYKDPGQSIFINQQYLGGFTRRLWQREYYSGVWSPWALIGPYDDTAVRNRIAALEAGGGAVQEQRTVSVAGDYRPDAWAVTDGTVLYWTGPTGTERIGWGYRGGGYVGRIGTAAGYSTMQVRKVQSTGEVEVSCLNPTTSRHVTYRVQGVYNVGQDEQRRIEETWVGTYTGTTVSKDLLIMPRSNIEWAFQIDVAGNKQFAPYHGAASSMAYQYEPATITDGNGDPLNIDGLAVNAVLTGVAGFKVRQRLYLTHPDTGPQRWAAVDEVHTIAPDGMLQTEAVVTFLQDTKLGSNYAPMTPVDQATFDKMTVLNGTSYTIKTVPPSTTEYIDVAEGHGVESALFTSTADPTAFVAVNYLDRDEGFARGHALEDKSARAMRIEQRSYANLTKLYPQPFAPGSVIPAGTVWRPAAQWRYGQVNNAAQYA